MRVRRFANRLCLFTGLAGLVGCGTGFDPPSELKTLRVLGVQKDKPMPQPGETVNLSMLWHDGLMNPLDPESKPRAMNVTWFTGCTNPATENFYGCFARFANVQRLEGETASITIDPEILETVPAPKEGQPLIGRTFVFFSICPGTVDFELSEQAGALPLACRDESGTRVGPDSFIVGYTSLLTYAGRSADGAPIENQNPIINGFQVKGTEIGAFCVDAECLEYGPSDEPPIDCSGEDPRCVPACRDDGDPTCPKISLGPIVDRESAELDLATQVFFGRNYLEQMWINYYVDRGSVRGDGVRLLNDATTGWSAEHDTEFYAPKEPGPVTVWAVVHDNRGGQSWVRTRLQITGDAPTD